MPQSLSKVIIHIIFSTKNREAWLDPDVRPRGVADHLHIVTTLPRTISQAAMVETVKKTSSKWIKGLDSKYRQFYWQRGYGAFSVSPSQLTAVLEYVESQEEDHCTHSFQQEYRDFFAQIRRRIRRTLCVGSTQTLLDSRFQRLVGGEFFLGRGPRLA